MNFKNFSIVVLTVAVTVLAYMLGLRNGEQNSRQRAARFHLSSSVMLYLKVEAGDLPGLKSSLGMLVMGQTRAFEKFFGDLPATDPFASRLTEARRISREVETNLVWIAPK